MNVAARTAVVGDNSPELITTTQLSKDFAHLEAAVAEALEFASNAPLVVEDDADISVLREAVRGLMAQHKRAEAIRVDTKQPYLNAERVVDGYFSKLKTTLNEVQSQIEGRAKRYLDKKAADEKARREEEARKAREEEQRQAAAARAAEQQAAEARRKAEEAATLAQTSQRADEAAKAAIAKADADASSAAAVAAQRKQAEALNTATQAQKTTEAKPAEMARTVASGGGMATLKQSFDFEIIDVHAIDLESIRSFIVQADLEKAIRRFVGAHDDTRPLAGVRIFPKTAAQFR
jgi:hypothetical protein